VNHVEPPAYFLNHLVVPLGIRLQFAQKLVVPVQSVVKVILPYLNITMTTPSVVLALEIKFELELLISTSLKISLSSLVNSLRWS